LFTYRAFLKKSLTIFGLFLLAVFIWMLLKYFKPVENQKEDLPDDTLDPTYEYGYGISY
tara:strand:- start:253 stop:429 length:177 start_codon:yes stop_codon:yes gene_type:complete